MSRTAIVIETLIVVAIVSLIAAVAIPSWRAQREREGRLTTKRVVSSEMLYSQRGWSKTTSIAEDGSTCVTEDFVPKGSLLECDWKTAEQQ